MYEAHPNQLVQLILVGAGLLLCCTLENEMPQENVLIRIPHENELISIRPRETCFHDFELKADEFLHVVVHQRGIDVGIQLRDPEGEVLIHVNSPNGTEGPEELVEIARTPGVYRFEVAAPEADVPAGHFTFRVLSHREAKAEDYDLVLADHAYHDARTLLKKAQWREAIQKLRDALKAWMQLGQTRREADTRHALCQAYQSLNEGELAIAYCEQALGLYRALDDRLMMAVALNRAGSIRQRLGQVQRSLPDFEEALSLFSEVGSQRELALTLAQLGTAYHRLGDFRKALDYFERALPMIERSVSSEREHAGVLLSKGSLLLALNRPWDALDHYRHAEEIYRQLHDEHRLARALNRTANVAFRLGEIEKAERDLDEAIRILRDQEKKGRTIDRDLAMAHILLCRIKARRLNLDEARTAAREALGLSRQAEDRQIEATALLELGHLLVLEENPSQGLAQLDEAFDTFAGIDDLTGQAMARIRSAEALRALGRLDEAWSRVAPALEIVERLRIASDRFDIRIDYFAFRQEFFEIAIDVLMDLHTREPEKGHHLRALEVHERRRARELLDVLAEAPVISRQEVDATLVAEERRLGEELQALTGAVEEQNLDEKIDHLVDQLRRVRGEIRQAKRRDVTVPPTAPIRLGQIQDSILDDNSLILVYSLGKARSYLWFISAKAVEAHVLPPRRTIEGIVHQLVKSLPMQSIRAQESRARQARELSEILLEPVAAKLGNHRLIVVPSGDLQRVPFSALPSPRTKMDGDFLIRHHEIIMLPSISALVSLRRAEANRQAPRQLFAVFADPVFSTDDPRVQTLAGHASVTPTGVSESEAKLGAPKRTLNRLARRLGFDPYKRLRHTQNEADAILALTPEENYLVAVGFDASRETFFQHDLGDFRILHFATHAFQDQYHSELSGLVLSLINEQGEDQDGFLRAFEISQLHLPVELVVLSACQTGRGKTIPGEGVMGLTRAFFDAGATRVISSLWRVDDQSTAQLMESFYQAYFGAGMTPPAALRQAQLTMLDDPQTAAPFDWAGFIFQGEWLPAPANTKKTSPSFQQDQEDTMTEEKSYRSIDPPEVEPPEDPVSVADSEAEDAATDEQLSKIAAEELSRLQKEDAG